MTKELTIKISDIPEKLEKKKDVWKIAKRINKVEQNLQWYKGTLWNACAHGLRQQLCDEFDWNYRTMEGYGNTVASFSNPVTSREKVSFSHYQAAIRAPKEKREEYLKKAEKEEWSVKDLREEISNDKQEEVNKKQKKKINNKAKQTATANTFDESKVSKEEDEEVFYEEDEYVAPPPTDSLDKVLSIDDAFSIFGISIVDETMTKETIKVLYRHYANKNHPDRGGNVEQMVQINEAKKLLEEDYYD